MGKFQQFPAGAGLGGGEPPFCCSVFPNSLVSSLGGAEMSRNLRASDLFPKRVLFRPLRILRPYRHVYFTLCFHFPKKRFDTFLFLSG